jgi:hypothetical protein
MHYSVRARAAQYLEKDEIEEEKKLIRILIKFLIKMYIIIFFFTEYSLFFLFSVNKNKKKIK